MVAPLVAVLDYGIGNLRSAQKALQHVGADARLTADHGVIADAAGVVLPGVGAFGACMDAVRASDLERVPASPTAFCFGSGAGELVQLLAPHSGDDAVHRVMQQGDG